jgi:hypothetical protein
MRHDLGFLLIAAASLVTGVSVGIYMGVTHDFRLTPVHAHINLLGWVSLALFGLAYRSYPELGRSWTAALHIALCGPSAVLLPAGIARAIIYDAPDLAICAALLWLAGCVTFLIKVAAMVSSDSTSDNLSDSSLG